MGMPGRSLRSKDHGDTSKDPLPHVLLLRLHLKTSCEDVGGTTGCGDIGWALIDSSCLLVNSPDSCDVDNWHNWMELLQLHLNEVTLFFSTAQFPACSLEEEASDIGANRCEVRVVLL